MCLQFAVKIFAFKTSLLTCDVIKLCQFLSDRFHLFRWRQSPKRTFVFLFFFRFTLFVKESFSFYTFGVV